MLRVVGDRLSEWAQQEEYRADSFARSAFNRYYYDSFLTVRDMLLDFGIDGRSSHHKDIPDMLTGSVYRKIKHKIKDMKGKGLLDWSEKHALERKVFAALSELSSTLETARNLRETADYEPEVTIDRVGGSLRLKETNLRSAGAWPHKTDRLVGRVRGVWREVGGA